MNLKKNDEKLLLTELSLIHSRFFVLDYELDRDFFGLG